MDKNYNVDNILDEIKRRKAREKGEAKGASPSADRLTMAPRRETQRADPGYAPSSRPAAPPKKDTVPQGETGEGDCTFIAPGASGGVEEDGGFRFVTASDDGVLQDATTSFTLPRPPRERPNFTPKGASARADEDGFEFVMPTVEKVSRNPMNFDGHVQSIADKARMRPNRFAARGIQPAAETPQKPSREAPIPPQPETPTPKSARKTRTEPFLETATPNHPQEFTFAPPAQAPANPPEFTFTPVRDEFTPVEDHVTQVVDFPSRQGAVKPEPKAIDFSVYRPPVDEDLAYRSPAAKDATGERTRILPRFDFSQELQLEDIQAMNLGGDNVFDYDDEPEIPFDADPGAPPADLGEYNKVEDRNAVGRDIAKVKRWLWLRTAVTFLLTVGLTYLTFSGKYPLPLPEIIFPEVDLRLFLLSFVVLSVLAALVCSSTVGNGLISLFKLRANSDTMAALAMLAAIGQSVTAVVNPEPVDIAAMCLYPCIAVLALFFNCLGKLTMINRIQTNFRIIAGNVPKRSVLPVESDTFCHTFLAADGRRRPTMAYGVKSGFFTDFLALSYSDKYDVGINRGVAPICLLGAVLVGTLTYMLTKSMSTAFSALTAILCVAATLSATFIENIPLSKLTRKIAPNGGMVSGNKAVEDFCDTKAVVLGEKDLFPPGHIQLHGIKAYSHGRIDEAILDAASVICATDSALSPVFLQMIGGNKKLLKKVDNIVCEDGKGISAWVDSRRILVGNRDLMRSHGVDLPDEAYEQKYAQEDGEVIFLSNSGEVSAQFVVSYRIDEELALELDHMAAKGIMLVVYAVDPNLTAQKLWSLYGFPQELIHVVPASLHTIYNEMSTPRERAIAEIVYTGKAWVMLRAIRACMGARTSILTATVIQLVQVILGYGMITFIAFMGAIGALSFLQIGVYQLFWFFAILLVQQLRQD